MVSFEFLAVIVSVLGLAASITYYANILNNANKTRAHQQLNSEENARTTMDLMTFNIKDKDEFFQEYDSTVNRDHYAKSARASVNSGYSSRRLFQRATLCKMSPV